MSDKAGPAKEFTIWWPQTKQGRGIWTLILGAAIVVGGIGGWNSAGRYDDQEGPAFVGALSGAAGWYFILVIIRYVAYWFTEGRKK